MSIVQISVVIYILHFERYFLSAGAGNAAARALVKPPEISGNGWKL